MKNIAIIVLSTIAMLSISIYIIRADSSIKVQVSILDACGEQIWPLNHKVPSLNAPTFDADIDQNGQIDLLIEGKGLYLQHLSYEGAVSISVYKGTKENNYEHLTTMPIDVYEQAQRKVKKNVPPSMTKSEAMAYYQQIQEDETYNGKQESPEGRERYRLQQKGGKVEPQKMLKAHKRVASLIDEAIQNPRKDAGLTQWSSIGPGNVGGRIRSMAINPNNEDEIFIGSVAGGLWRSTNGGSSWSNISDVLPNMAIMQILYDPNNTNIMYCSTGEGIGGAGIAVGLDSPGTMNIGIGLMRSVNGGLSWTPLPQPVGQSFFWVNDIAIDPNNTSHIYAVTSDSNNQTNSGNTGAIYKSTDSGQSWTQIRTTTGRAIDIKIDPFDSDNVLVGTSSRIYRSTNATNAPNSITFTVSTGGVNQPPSGGRCELAWARSNQDRVYASVDQNGGEVWRSEDAGSTWSRRSTGVNYLNNQGWYDNVIWVDPLFSSRIVVGGIDLYYSADGGSNLNQISDWNDDIHLNDNDGDGNQGTSVHADQHVILEAPNYSSTNRKVYIGNDGGIYKTDNIVTVSQNSGWDDLNNNIRITQFYGGAASADRSLVIGGAQDNAFVVDRTFGGSNWVVPFSGDGAFAAVNFNNENIAFANTNTNQIFRTLDNGQTWTWVAAFNNGGCNNGCVNGGVFRVADNASLISKFIIDPNVPTTLYACSNRLWRNNASANPNNWTNIRNANGGQITAMDVGTSTNRLWVGTVNGRIDRSTVGGGTAANNWTRMDNVVSNAIPNRFITDISVSRLDQNDVMITIGGYGQDNIWLTTDNGSTWNNRSLDFDMQINTIVWHPTKSGWVYIGTDFGVFASENWGQDWSVLPISDVNDGPFNGEVSELFFTGDGSDATPYYLYAATFGRGMWRTSYPLRDKIYINKSYVGPESGSITQPYNTVNEAVAAAGSGSEIIFLSSGTHDESSGFLIKNKVTIKLQNGGSSVIIK